MAQKYGSHSGVWARPFAVLYAVTVGLVVGVVVTIIGTIGGLIGTVLRVGGVGENPDSQTMRPFWKPFTRTLRWWTDLWAFALLGRGTFMLSPDLD